MPSPAEESLGHGWPASLAALAAIPLLRLLLLLLEPVPPENTRGMLISALGADYIAGGVSHEAASVRRPKKFEGRDERGEELL